MSINVLTDILEWSSGRPPWQRDALRRLIVNGNVSEADISELANLCKSRHGLAARENPSPLISDHLPQPNTGIGLVRLESLTHHRGVNALANDQTIEFGPCLTVVYGGNAAGKSGYTRILKSACRARRAEEILGNVVSTTVPRPSATIEFTAGGKALTHSWDDSQPLNDFLSKVSVFDRHCAGVYVAEQTDVAYRPMGLDLFDKLSEVCSGVRKILEREQNALESGQLRNLDVASGTAVHELITNLNPLTNPNSVRELATLTAEESQRIQELRTRLRDLQSADPATTARTIELRARRAEILVERVNTAEELFAEDSKEELFNARDMMEETQRAAEGLRKLVFDGQPLPNTGSDSWRALWEAARRFSAIDAYPGAEFPFTEEGSLCVLCQQPLVDEAVHRLQQFRDFLESAIQGQHEQAVSGYRERKLAIEEGRILDDQAREVLHDIQIDEPGLAEAVLTHLTGAEEYRQELKVAITENKSFRDILPFVDFDLEGLQRYIENSRQTARELRLVSQPEAVDRLMSELCELESRQVLAGHLSEVLEEVERKKRVAVYQVCMKETQTTAITRKSSEVTRQAVTEQLIESFEAELKALRFRHVEVHMVDSGGSRGVLYHRLRLRRAPETEVPKVVSEGEARCLSIASFFAELSTSDDRSAILFDDPVSSLDHEWRDNVADRLVLESQNRQVIVFTHDIVFLLALTGKAEQLGVNLKSQHLWRDANSAGFSSQELPLLAMKVSDRVGVLKKLWQDADKEYRKGDKRKYERDGAYIYGLLREAWERGFEEVLLGGSVERYRKTIETQRAKCIADIEEGDLTRLQAGMTKCSRWLAGHDQAPAENAAFPDSNELLDDIEALKTWVQDIRKRRR